jgi:glycosyltransferase involved in cell wall biosynthesis
MKSASQPLVSVVTPVHNESAYLAECIESVLAQTYENWDYTIVDNCSTDGSAEIAHKYAARDRRIRVHENQHFLPAIANHNCALSTLSPTSKYCKVVLGDDWIFPECLQRMVGLAEQQPSVGIVSAYALEGQQVKWTGLPYPAHRISGREICRKHLLDELYVFGTPTTVLYRSDLVRSRDRFYDETNIHADTDVCFALLQKCDFAFVHQVLSFTREQPGSLSTTASDLHAYFPAMLQLLLTYGPYYLAEGELEERLERHLSEYYMFLGKSLLAGRNEEFWEYHQGKLARTSVGFSKGRLAKGASQSVLRAALHPRVSMGKLLQRRKSGIQQVTPAAGRAKAIMPLNPECSEKAARAFSRSS